MTSNAKIKIVLVSAAMLLAAPARPASLTFHVSGIGTQLAEFEPEATYKAHYKKDGQLHPSSSKFISGDTFSVENLFTLAPTDLPDSVSLISLLLDLTPAITNSLSVQKPEEAPGGGTFATVREITGIRLSAGDFVQYYSSPGLIDLLAAGLKSSDFDNHPLQIGWTTTVSFTGRPGLTGQGNSQHHYLLQNTGSSLLSATLSGEYAEAGVPSDVPEPPTIALFGFGFLAAVLCGKWLKRRLAV
jgi:hypothetical protein